MKGHEAEEEAVPQSIKEGSLRFNGWFRRLYSHRWFYVTILLVAMAVGLSGAYIQKGYGEGVLAPLVVEAYYVIITNYSGKLDCEALKDRIMNVPQETIDSLINTNGFSFADFLIGAWGLSLCKYFFPSASAPKSINAAKVQTSDMKYPYYIAANLAGTRIYTANYDSSVSVVDVATWSPIGTIQFPSHLDGGDTDYTFWDIAINPMGTRLYVLNTIYRTTLPTYTRLGNTVEVIDTEKNAVVASVPLGLKSQPNDVVVDATGSKVYVTTSDIEIHDTGQTEYLDSGKVNVIDAVTNTIVKTIAFSGQAPGPLVAHPDGSRVYAGTPRYSFFSNALQAFVDVPARLSVVETTQDTVVKTIELGGKSPRRLAINPRGTRLYVAYGTDDNFLEVVDTASNQVITKIYIPVDSPAIGDIEVTADGTFLKMTVDVSTGDPDLIYFIDTSNNTIAARFELLPDTQPDRMALFATVNDGHVPLSNFSSASLILQVPVIQVPEAGEYNASFVLSDPANLELTLTDVAGTGFQTGLPAVFSPATGVLTIPVLGIDGKAFYQVDLSLVTEPGSLRFRVTQVEPLP